MRGQPPRVYGAVVRMPVADEMIKRALVGTRRLYTPVYAAKLEGATRQAIHKSAARRYGQRLMWVFYEPEIPLERHSAVFVDYGWLDQAEDAEEWRLWADEGTTAIEQLVMEAVCRHYGFERQLADGTRTRDPQSPPRQRQRELVPA